MKSVSSKKHGAQGREPRSPQRLVMRLCLIGDECHFRHFVSGKYSKRICLVEALYLFRHHGGHVAFSPRPRFWFKSHNEVAERRP